MKVLVALDSFKGSLSSVEAGEAVKRGVLRVCPDAECTVRPLADGGEGTVDALNVALGGSLRRVTVTGPAGTPVEAVYSLAGDMAVMEMASAAGITLVPDEERNPLTATTFGVGEMIADAVRAGARRFVVGIGGSATNDGGAGMLQALGFSLCDADGNEIARGGAALKNVCAIDATHVMPELAHCEFKIACDVTNPLCGENGASAVFGPQKGATPEMVAELDAALANFADAAGKCDDARYPGAGAAGGLGFAFKAFLGGELKRGIEIVLDVTRFAEYAAAADVVVTGEGRLDAQTAMGKAPVGVAAVAKRFGKKVVAFAGALGEGAEAVNAHGIDAFFPILRSITTLEAALDKATAAANLSATVEQVFRILKMQEI